MMAVVLLALAGLSRDELPRWRTVPVPPTMPKPLESGMAPVNGIAMYYAIYGHGPPILLIHGGLSNADVWSSEIPGLTTRHEVIVADSRGHGRSTRTDERFTYDLMASDYLALLDYLRVGKVAVVGWSDGGVIGLDLAIHHPDRLTALYVQAANASPDGLTWIPTAAAALQAPGGRDMAEYRRLSPTPDQFVAFRKAIFEMWATEPHFTRQQLASIKVRAAIVIGDHDNVVRRSHTLYLTSIIPGAHLIILPDVSHFALLQDPATYVQTVLDFIDADTRFGETARRPWLRMRAPCWAPAPPAWQLGRVG